MFFKTKCFKRESADSITAYYRQLFKEFGDSPESVRYSSKETQFRRFKLLAEVDDLTGTSILDFGSGVGHLLEYFQIHNQKIGSYVGVEVVAEMVEFSKKKFPQADFVSSLDERDLYFDYGFVSGTFNNKIAANRKFWKKTITDLFYKCNKGIAFNMMSTYVDFQDKQLYYESPEYVFTFIKKNLTPYVVLRHDFETKKGTIPFEFVIYAYKQTNELE